MNLTITNSDYNKNNSPNFKKMEHFDYIKKLDGMICAVCGRETLTADTFVKANTPNCRPLIENLQNQTFKVVEEKFPTIWKLLIRYTKDYPEKSLDKIMEDSACYIELKQIIAKHIEDKKTTSIAGYKDPEYLDRSVGATFFNLLEASRTNLQPASIVVKNLECLKSFLSEEQLRTFELLKTYSEKYPDKTLSEIINTEEIYTYHNKKDRINRTSLYNKMYFHLDNIINLIEKERPDALPDFYTKKISTIKMFREVADPEERIFNAKGMYRNALEINGCSHLIDKVYKELDSIPKTFMTADTFFAYAHKHNWSDGKILSEIFNSNFATEEHLEAVAEGGIDKIENKIVMHKFCNQLRNRIPYPRFLQYHPEMQKNIQYQVDLVSDALLKEELPHFIDFYPLKMPLKLAEKTNNMLNIDITKYCQEGTALSVERENLLREELSRICDLRDKKIFEKIKCKGPNPELDKEIKFLQDEMFRVKESIKIEGKKRYRMWCYLNPQGEQE